MTLAVLEGAYFAYTNDDQAMAFDGLQAAGYFILTDLPSGESLEGQPHLMGAAVILASEGNVSAALGNLELVSMIRNEV